MWPPYTLAVLGLLTEASGVDVLDLVRRRLLGLADGGTVQLSESMQVIKSSSISEHTHKLCVVTSKRPRL